MRVVPGNAQHIGRRKEQQDAFAFSNFADERFTAHGGVLSVVADGMGGMEKGGESSHIAVRVFLQEYALKLPTEPIPQALERALRTANLEVCRFGRDYNTGTTLVAAVVMGMELYWISVGDSRLYLCRNAKLSQLTQDHNVAVKLAEAVKRGIISKEDAEQHPDSNALTSYLGAPELSKVDQNTTPFSLARGDWLLLCSDGVYGTLGHADMCDALWGVPQEAAERLMKQVLLQNSPRQDNATVAVMACDADLMIDGEGGRSLHLGTTALLVLAFFTIVGIWRWLLPISITQPTVDAQISKAAISRTFVLDMHDLVEFPIVMPINSDGIFFADQSLQDMPENLNPLASKINLSPPNLSDGIHEKASEGIVKVSAKSSTKDDMHSKTPYVPPLTLKKPEDKVKQASSKASVKKQKISNKPNHSVLAPTKPIQKVQNVRRTDVHNLQPASPTKEIPNTSNNINP